MTPNAADSVVSKVQTVLTGGAKKQKQQQKKKVKLEPKAVSLLKFPHHGSGKNYIPSWDDLVGNTTQVIVSGAIRALCRLRCKAFERRTSGISILTTKPRHDFSRPAALCLTRP
jgi:hypothetical protein